VTGEEGRVTNGVLCGSWRRTDGESTPHAGDQFRFVSVSPQTGDAHQPVTWIYGDVVATNR
jgi:hypothetical protein